MTVQPVILAGGSGTRLWPLSRELYPKQFLPLMGERSLFQDTIRRLDGIDGVAPPLVVCNEEHRFLVAEHLRQMKRAPFAIALEPAGRNTAPALTLAALMLADAAQPNNDPVMLVMPADHVIQDAAGFRDAAMRGAELAAQGGIVTFGIAPHSPQPGYGYIRKGAPIASDDCAQAFQIAEFVEKPERARAERMLESQKYLWNSGIFMMRASVWLSEISRLRPEIAAQCAAAHNGLERDGDFQRPDAESFAQCPSESIDYAVMEHIGDKAPQNGAARCLVLPMNVGWTDLGAWSSLWDVSDRDDGGNLLRGDVYAKSMSDSVVISQQRLVAAVGLKDVILIETADAVLAAHKERVQDVKDLVECLKSDNRDEHANHRRVNRPWGTYETIDLGERFRVKRLTITPGEALSLQMHHHRAEHWVVVNGTAKVTIGGEQLLLTENQSAYVPMGVKHRLENPGSVTLEVIEVQTGSYLEEDDIKRFDDRYNRITPSSSAQLPA